MAEEIGAARRVVAALRDAGVLDAGAALAGEAGAALGLAGLGLLRRLRGRWDDVLDAGASVHGAAHDDAGGVALGDEGVGARRADLVVDRGGESVRVLVLVPGLVGARGVGLEGQLADLDVVGPGWEGKHSDLAVGGARVVLAAGWGTAR